MCERDAAAGVRGGEVNKRRSLCDYVRLHSLISYDSLFLLSLSDYILRFLMTVQALC